jgi:hypothetical protein
MACWVDTGKLFLMPQYDDKEQQDGVDAVTLRPLELMHR